MPGLVAVGYINVSGSPIPPYGVIQFTGAAIVTATGGYVLQATTPGSGTGPYFVDDGGGAATSGATQYGSCYRAVDGVCWVAYGCTSSPGDPWTKVGPVIGQFFVSAGGDGFFYAGVYDVANSRILCLMSTFSPTTVRCSSSSSSSVSSSSVSSGSSSSGASGSGSSSGACGCVTVVTGVSCSGGSLSVTYGSARGCC